MVSDPGPTSIFDPPVYERGGMMLAALRCRLGKRPMMDLVRAWVDQHRDGTGTGEQFRALAGRRERSGPDGLLRRTGSTTPIVPRRTEDNGLTCS